MPLEPRNGSEKKSKRTDGTAHPVKARKDKTHTGTARKATTRKIKETREAKETRPAAPAASPLVPSRQSSVAVIGAGRLGSALALALNQSGYAVVALIARRAASARRAARALSPRPLALDATQLDLLPDTVDLILITTPDDQIAQVAARLAGVSAARRVPRQPQSAPRQPQSAPRQSHGRPRVALHASGALVSGALAPLGAHGFSLGSLHPLVSVSDPAGVGAGHLRGAFYCLEGEARALAAARRIVRALGGRSFSIAARDKSLYHAAAVIASGHTVALFSLAAELLALCGLSDARARRVLLPLLASTLDNLNSHAPDKALTGTFARADLSTVRKHLAALRDAGDYGRDAIAVYALLGGRSLQMAARRKQFDPSVAAEIALLLRKALKASGGD